MLIYKRVVVVAGGVYRDDDGGGSSSSGFTYERFKMWKLSDHFENKVPYL